MVNNPVMGEYIVLLFENFFNVSIMICVAVDVCLCNFVSRIKFAE